MATNDFQLLKARHFARKIAVWVEWIDASHSMEELPVDFGWLAHYSDELNQALEKADLSEVEAMEEGLTAVHMAGYMDGKKAAEAKLAQQDDLVQAAVAAALKEAVAAIKKDAANDDISHGAAQWVSDTILALITPDAQTALDRAVAAERERAYNAGRKHERERVYNAGRKHERERAYNAGRKHERDLIHAFAQRMDTEGKAYAEQILAAIREGQE